MGDSAQHSDFEVHVLGYGPSSLEDWRRSLEAPPSELPELSSDKKAVAHKFGIADEKYARSRLSLQYGHQRQERKGYIFGEILQKVLAGVRADLLLREIIYDPEKARWVARIQSPDEDFDVSIPRDLADDVVDLKNVEYRNRLRFILKESLDPVRPTAGGV